LLEPHKLALWDAARITGPRTQFVQTFKKKFECSVSPHTVSNREQDYQSEQTQ